jgi:hypothetical protein
MGLAYYLHGLASNLDPPDLSLPSSWNYRCKPPAPSFIIKFFPAKNNLMVPWVGARLEAGPLETMIPIL